jgi:hypothetical protein
MRVDYTVPALQPESLPEPATTGEPGLSFRDQLRGPAAAVPVSCEHQLRLDVRPFTATYIGPPPRPQNLQLNDPETEHLRWHNMVQRHSRALGAAGAQANSNGSESVRTMLEMLQDMQQMEDSIVSRQVAVTRG